MKLLKIYSRFILCNGKYLPSPFYSKENILTAINYYLFNYYEVDIKEGHMVAYVEIKLTNPKWLNFYFNSRIKKMKVELELNSPINVHYKLYRT